MKKPLKTLLTGIGLCILGAVIPIATVVPVLMHKDAEKQFLVPGKTEVTVAETGRYYLWNEYVTEFEGKSYHSSADNPGGLAIAFSGENGTPMPFVNDSDSSSENGSESRKSIGYVDVAKPGTLTVSVSGNTEPRVFSVSKSAFSDALVKILVAVGVGMLVGFVGFIVAVVGIVGLIKGPKSTPPRVAPNSPVIP